MDPINIDSLPRARALAEADYSEPDYVVPGLPLGLVGSLIAAGASGKSIFELQQCISIAIGADGYTRGQVLYLAAEDPVEELGKRVKAILAAWEVSEEEMELADRNLWIVPLLAKEPDLEKKAENSDTYELIAIIRQLAKQIASKSDDSLRLIVFDTLRRFHFSDENDGGAMARVLGVIEQLCAELSCSAMFLHHINKASALNGSGDSQQAARGSSVLTDNIRFQQFLSCMSKDEAEKYALESNKRCKIGEDDRKKYVRWGVSKQNYAAPIPDVWYERGDNGVLYPVEIVRVEKRKKNDD